MIDEKMINSVKRTLSFLDGLNNKTTDELKAIINSQGLSCNSFTKQEMVQVIFEKYITGEDLTYYHRYLDYARRKNVDAMSDTLDNLTGLIARIDKTYEQRKDITTRRRNALNNIDGANKGMINFPLIRASIAYSHVESSKDSYIHTRTVDGMKRAKLSDEISDIANRGIIVRAVKANRVKKLKERLEVHNQRSIPRVDKAHDRYTKSVKEYTVVLRELFYDLLDNMEVRKRAYMSYILVLLKDINYNADDLGIKEPTEEELANIDKESIYKAFLDFAKFEDAATLDSKEYFDRLKEFITYYDHTIVSRADYKISALNSKIAKLFEEQKEIVRALISKRDKCLDNDQFSEDEEDTYSLVFTGLDSSNKN